MAYTALVSFMLDEDSPTDAWKYTCALLSADPFVGHSGLKDVLSVEISEPSEDDIWPHSGAALISFRVALWAALTASNFRDGITKAAKVGGDVETYAAIAGGMLGAHFGIDGIPPEWRDVLIGQDIMLKLAGDLYRLAGN